MTYKQIEASREVRLWIRDIIVPAATAVATIVYLNPDLRAKAADKVNEVKYKIKTKLNK